MISKEMLLKLGFKEKNIQKFIKQKSLFKFTQNVYTIKSDSLLNLIFKRSLEYDLDLASELYPNVSLENQFYYLIVMGKIDEAAVLSGYVTKETKFFKIINYLLFNTDIEISDIKLHRAHVEELKEYYNLLYKYIYYREVDMIKLIISKILELGTNDFNLFMLNKCCDEIIVNSEYFFDFLEYRNLYDARNILTSMERDLLFYLEIENYIKVNEILEKLLKIYDNDDGLIIVKRLFQELVKVSKFKKTISSHDYNRLIGPTFRVLLELIVNRDYYRFEEVVCDLLDDMDEFSFILEIYRIFIDRILVMNKRNLDNIFLEIKDNSIGDIDDIKLYGKYNISKISSENLFDYSESEDFDQEIDYYQEYLNYYHKNDYQNAYDAIIKHKTHLRNIGNHKNINYLIQELEVLMFNSKAIQKNKSLEKEYLEKADECIKLRYYDMAIEYLNKSIMYQKKENPYTKSKVAYLYYELGDYKKCIEIYESITKYILKPEDFIIYIKSLYKSGEFQNCINLSKHFKSVYGEDNNILYYIKMCSYLKMKNYDQALKELLLLEDFTKNNNHELEKYSYEKNIIENARLGESVDLDVDEFYDFNIKLDEEKLYQEIKGNDISQEYINDLINSAKSYEDIIIRINYLMTIIKSLYFTNKTEYSKEVINELESTLNECDYEVKTKILRVLNVYNNNF